MTEVINLNKHRKAKTRKENEKKASQNRLKFGRTTQEKKREKLQSTRTKKELEGHKLENDDDPI